MSDLRFALMFKSSLIALTIALMSDLRLLRCMQGGGVAVGRLDGDVVIGSATVTFESCSIIGNTAIDAVRAQVPKFLSPCWSVHMFCACACRTVVSMSMAVQLHSAAAKSTPM